MGCCATKVYMEFNVINCYRMFAHFSKFFMVKMLVSFQRCYQYCDHTHRITIFFKFHCPVCIGSHFGLQLCDLSEITNHACKTGSAMQSFPIWTHLLQLGSWFGKDCIAEKSSKLLCPCSVSILFTAISVSPSKLLTFFWASGFVPAFLAI